MNNVYFIDRDTLQLIGCEYWNTGGRSLVGDKYYTHEMKSPPMAYQPMNGVTTTWAVVKHTVIKGVHIAFIEKERAAISTGDSLCVSLVNTNGETTTLGPYKIPHDTACFHPNSSGRELGEELMHALARQDPLPIIDIAVKKNKQ